MPLLIAKMLPNRFMHRLRDIRSCLPRYNEIGIAKSSIACQTPNVNTRYWICITLGIFIYWNLKYSRIVSNHTRLKMFRTHFAPSKYALPFPKNYQQTHYLPGISKSWSGSSEFILFRYLFF